MNGLIIGALMVLAPVQQTDTIIEVGSAETLSVETLGGSIEISVWDEERIRVQAEHSNRTFIEIDRRNSGRVIDIEAEARRGPANLVDFRITVPRRFALDLEAQYGDITIEGSDGTVKAETLQGDITILGGRGTIEVEATIGSILVEGADGKIEIESSAADIRVVDSSGEIYAETAGGSIVLENVSPSAVDVGSTGGRVHYDGSFEPNGTYFFGAHGGSITIVIPDGAAASLNVATVHGSISSNLNGEVEALRGGQRHQIEVGGGGAIVEAETYGGRIRLLRRGSEGSQAPGPNRNRNRDGGDEGWAPLADDSGGEWEWNWAWDMAGVPEADAEWTADHEMDMRWDADHDMDWDADHGTDWDDDHDMDMDMDVDQGRETDETWDRELRVFGVALGSRVGADHALEISARVAPRVVAEVANRVDAMVAPRIAAQAVAPMDLQLAPVVAAEVVRMLDLALDLDGRSPVAPGPATIRR